MIDIENRMVVDSEWREPKPKCHCDICDNPLYEDDRAYFFDGMIICDDCLVDYMKENYRQRIGDWHGIFESE